MEHWRKVWRDGFAKAFNREHLSHLAEALKNDDVQLIQGATTNPPPLMCVQDWPCEGACAVSYAGWKAGASTVGEVETFFAKACFDADQRLGDPAACRFFLNWFDDTPRAEMRRELLAEVELALAQGN